MRAVLLAVLLLGPGLASAIPEDARDIIVVVRPCANASAPSPAHAVRLSVLDAFVLRDAPASLEAALRSHPCVERVEPSIPLVGTADPNLRLTRAEPAPAGATGALAGRGVTVAVVDSGIDATHPDLAGRVKANVKLVEGRFVDAPGDADGHGTHVAGIVAASGASSDGKWRGVAPEAELVGVDISDRFTTTSALLAYDWLFVNHERLGIRVVVNAWGRVGERYYDVDDPIIRAIDRLVDDGVVVLFSASNHGPAAASLSAEAQNPRVVTVGAVDAAARLMPYSSRGPVASTSGASWVKPDVVAPGESIVGLRSLQSAPRVSDVDALHREYSGTSQAVPHVAGIVALMLEANPRLGPVAVQNALRESAVDLAEPGPDHDTGFGLVDALDAVNRAASRPADRGNVLVAGGVDRYEDSARVTPVTTRGGILGLGSTSSASWSTTFPVKSGAERLSFELAWTTPATGVSVTLRHEGAPQGTWGQSSVEGSRVVVRGRVDDPEPGLWTLEARGAAPLAVEVSATVDVELLANATRAIELDSRYRSPDTPTSALGSVARGDVASAMVQAKLFVRAHPGALAMLATGYMLAFLVLRRRRA